MGSQKAKAERLRSYSLGHLGEVARSFTDVQDELLELRVHPGRSIYKDLQKRTALLEGLQEELLIYLGQILDDLRIMASGHGGSCGKRGAR